MEDQYLQALFNTHVLRIVPISAGVTLAMRSARTLFSFAKADPVVYTENEVAMVFSQDPAVVREGKRFFAWLRRTLWMRNNRGTCWRSTSADREGTRMTQGRAWRKSTYSGPKEGSACVEVSLSGDARVRDSKNANGDRLVFTIHAWRAFLARVA
ncbi:Scr1 family TA system antitoxin-like transcriptional regulator [Lentzea chajnantorensis]